MKKIIAFAVLFIVGIFAISLFAAYVYCHIMMRICQIIIQGCEVLRQHTRLAFLQRGSTPTWSKNSNYSFLNVRAIYVPLQYLWVSLILRGFYFIILFMEKIFFTREQITKGNIDQQLCSPEEWDIYCRLRNCWMYDVFQMTDYVELPLERGKKVFSGKKSLSIKAFSIVLLCIKKVRTAHYMYTVLKKKPAAFYFPASAVSST